ncbi:hypothetical protein ACFVFI_34875 [Streptomyces sp. NPDC057705]|uniref:hypothetical protein n=1 Tax=Streptomyces sp. NPDC057705 TaxID=3346222 RepID=UPI0036ACDFA8
MARITDLYDAELDFVAGQDEDNEHTGRAGGIRFALAVLVLSRFESHPDFRRIWRP